MAKATLLVIQGSDQGSRFKIEDEPVGVGRGVQNEIRILDTEVSRRHATIQYIDGSFVVADRNSSNGTFVNGVAFHRRELKSGDQIQIGRTVILFSEAVDKDESKLIAEQKVDLFSQSGADERSSIVGEVSHKLDPSLLQGSASGQAQDTAQSLANLQVLYRISEEAVRPSISLEQLLKRILDLTIEAVGADRGCMLIADPQTGQVVPQVLSYRRGVDETLKMPVSRSIVDYVLRKGQGVRTSDARADSRFATGQSILQAGIREAMCVPIQGRYELLGVIYLDITTPPEKVIPGGENANKLDEDLLRLTVAIGRQSALAIENNRYQQAFVKAERLAAVGQTIATLSHNIKNILQGVRGGSYLIDMGLKDENQELVRKGWHIVEKNQNKIYHLVMDMLTFSKERQPSLQRADLNETVNDVCELMQARAEESGLKLSYNLSSDLPETTFDPEAIHRAVLNIVSNALDAVEGIEGGAVHIETIYDSPNDSFAVIISDNGPGIPEDQVQRIFNLFESTKGARGTGLGLAVSRKIIREHGGEILVESQPGEGAKFTLTWPRMEDEQRVEEGQTQA